MKLQQLRYVIQVAESGSLTAAAERLFVAQPSLSKAVAELEREMGVTIFTRSRTGVELTEEGTRFLSYARQVVEQADLLEAEYKGGTRVRRVFGVSAQHYAFVVNAFVRLVREHGASSYEFSLRESTTAGILDDVRVQRSEGYYTADQYKQGQYIFGNIFYSLTPRCKVAAEYLYGSRKDMNSMKNHANRVNVMVQYNF